MTKAQLEYQEYLQTPYWKKASDEVKRRAGYRCQVCNSDKALETHHRSYEHRGNEMEHLEDLICLCHECHDRFHRSMREPVPAPTPVPVVKRQPRKHKSKRKKIVSTPIDAELRAQLELYGCDRMVQGRRIIGRVDLEHIEEVLMPPGYGAIALTERLIYRCKGINGQFTKATLEALRVDKEREGWIQRIVGRRVSRTEYLRALFGRQVVSTNNPNY
jgi:hypothetical protein